MGRAIIFAILGEKMINEYDYKNLELSYPHVASRIVESYPDGVYGYILVLDSGERVLYDLVSLTVRYLPQDVANMTEEEYSAEFSFRLRRMMTVRGLTQSELASMVGVSQGAISRYVRGEGLPTTYTLYLIAKALNCSTDEFRYL